MCKIGRSNKHNIREKKIKKTITLTATATISAASAIATETATIQSTTIEFPRKDCESIMTYNTMLDEDARSIASLASLHEIEDTFEDLDEKELNPDIDAKRSMFSKRTTKDISMDFNDLLQGMEEERETSGSLCDDASLGSIGSTGSLSLNLDEEVIDESAKHMGSKLKLDDIPSRGRMWGSINWGSFSGSFSKLGSSRRLGSSMRLGSSRRVLRRKKSQRHSIAEKPDQPDRRKKTVRFKKFETVFPSMESFRRLHVDGDETNRRRQSL